jgi:trimeric autotransporter adhesin
MFGGSKKGDNKSSSSSSGAKTTNATSQKSYASPYGGASASSSSKFTLGGTSKSSTTYGGSAGAKSTTTTSSSSYGFKYPTSSSSTASQKPSSSFGSFKTDAAPSNSYGKPTSSSAGYKTNSFAISSPKITNFDKTALERRPLTAKPYAESKITTFPMPSSLSTKSSSKYESSQVTYPEFETELRKYNLGSSSENYGLYKTLRSELPKGSYLTAAKLTTRVNQHSSHVLKNQQTTTSTYWSSGDNPSALKTAVVTGAVAAPMLVPKTPGAKYDESRLKSISTNDPRKPVTFNPSAPPKEALSE